jgi:undecaprenyl-diphosphatase
MISADPSSPSPRPHAPARSWGERLKHEARALAGRWRRPSVLTPAFPALALTFAFLVVMVLTRLAFEIDAAAIHVTRVWPSGVIRFFRTITDLGTSGWMFALGFVTIAACTLTRGRGRGLKIDAGLLALSQRAVYVLATIAVSGIFAQIVKQIVGRGRPKFLDSMGPFTFDSFAGQASFASFPSGHSTNAFAVCVALSFFMPRWRVPLLLVATLIACSRIVIGAHYPSDTIAGAFLGSVCAYMVARAFARREIAFAFRSGRLAPRALGAVDPALRQLFSKRSA